MHADSAEQSLLRYDLCVYRPFRHLSQLVLVYNAHKKPGGSVNLSRTLTQARHIPFCHAATLKIHNKVGVLLPRDKRLKENAPTMCKHLGANYFDTDTNPEWKGMNFPPTWNFSDLHKEFFSNVQVAVAMSGSLVIREL